MSGVATAVGPWAVTGTGLVTPAGDTATAVFEALLGRGRAAGTTSPIPDFDVRGYVKRKGAKLLSRTSRLACAAAAPLAESLDGLEASEIGVVFGSAWATLDSIVRFEREAHVDGPRFVDPILFTETVANVPAGQVSIFFGWSALNATVAAGSASGLEAVRRAGEFLEDGRASVVVAGGGDELSDHLVRTLGVDEGIDANRPPCGEAACFLAIEPAARALDRGAAPYATLLAAGTGFAGDDPSASAVAAVVRQVLAGCDTGPGDVDLLIASSGHVDAAATREGEAVAELFGDDVPPAIAPKLTLGETWAAGGPLGVVLAAEAIRRAEIPAAPEGASARCGFRLPDATVRRSVRRALVLDCSATGHVAAAVVAAAD